MVDISLSLNNDCGRQQSQSDFQMVCYNRLVLCDRKLCFDHFWEMAWSLSLDAMPGDLDLYVYLDIEVFINLLQWISFCAMPSRTLNPLSVVIVGSMSSGFCHSVVWSVIGLSNFLLLVFGLFVIYILHYYYFNI